MAMRHAVAAGLFAALLGHASAQSVLAPTPPMGWNSWDAYGPAVREDEVKANARAMSERLKAAGWQYVVVDIEWYQPDAHAHGYIPGGRVALDAYGRFQPAVSRFPSSADGAGFKPLADYVHGLGLKFGIHMMRGIPREAVRQNLPIEGTPWHAADVADKVDVCPWQGMEDTYGVDMRKPGAQAYYDSLARMYARWGVDFVKADDMSRPLHTAEVEALHRAIVKSGRPMVLSLSPGPAKVADDATLRANAQMWRVSDDFWDRWEDVKAQFGYLRAWQGRALPGGWPDADMLPLGHIGIRAERGADRSSLLTHDEQRTLMTLWAMARSPLMMGGDLPTSDAWTYGLLTNRAVLAVDQASAGGRESYHDGDVVAWTADAPDGGQYVAVFNTGDAEAAVDLPWKAFAVAGGVWTVSDLWEGTDRRGVRGVRVELRPHASVLWRLGR